MAGELVPTVLAEFFSLQLLISSATAVIGWLLLAGIFRLSRLSKPAGKKLGIEKSNLADEFEYPANGDEDWKIKSLWIYPVKSCKGVELDQANVVPTG